MQKVQAPGDKRFCPVDSCNRSIHGGAGPLAPSSLRHHLERMHQARGERLSDGMLVPLGLRLCPKVGCGKVIEAKFEVCGGCVHFFAEGLLDRRDTEARPEVGPREIPQDLPSLDEIALRRVPLLSPIPKALRAPWARALREATQEVLTHRDDAAWRKFMMLLKVVLVRRRGGRAHVKRSQSEALEVFRRWHEGECVDLWYELREAGSGGGSRVPEPEAGRGKVRAKAVALAREGLYSKAHSALFSRGVAPLTPEVRQQLEEKHPLGVPVEAAEFKQTTNLSFLPLQVYRSLQRFKAGSAGGPSGLSADHVKVAVGEGDGMLQRLTLLVNLVVAGGVPEEVRPMLFGANLIPLRKVEKHGVRPVACGDTLRRLCGKLVGTRYSDEARKVLFVGRQVGVGVKMGMEAAVAMVAGYAKRWSGHDKCIVKIDFANAFNTVDRTVFLREARRLGPAMMPFLLACYSAPTSLYCGDAVLSLACGVQQGDPLGPLLFSLAVRRAAEEVAGLEDLDASVWFLDDGTLLGSPEACGRALSLVQERCREVGLAINVRKTEVVALGGQSRERLRRAGLPVGAEEEAGSVVRSVSAESAVSGSVSAESVVWRPDGRSWSVVGPAAQSEEAPDVRSRSLESVASSVGPSLSAESAVSSVGRSVSMESAVSSPGRSQSVESAVSSVGPSLAVESVVGAEDAMAEPEPEARLPRDEDVGCTVVSGPNFELLGAPIGDRAFCEAWMAAKMEEFRPLLRELGELQDRQVALALLQHCGGFCRLVFYMRSLGHVGARDYLASFDAEVERTLCNILGAQLPENARVQCGLAIRRGGLGVRWASDHCEAAALAAASGTFDLCRELDPEFVWDADGWRESATAFNRRVDAEDRVDPGVRLAPKLCAQRRLSQAVEVKQHAGLLERGDETARARLLSLLLPCAGASLTAVPSWQLRIREEEFLALLRVRLGLAVFAGGAECKQCHGPLDQWGEHVQTCERTSDRITRHNAVVVELLAVCRDLNLGPQLEPLGLLADCNAKPADVFLPGGVGGGRGMCLDVTIHSPFGAANLAGAAQQTGFAAKKAEAAKREKAEAACAAAPRGALSFVPVAMESLGGLGESAWGLVRQLARYGGRVCGVSPTALQHQIGQRLSVAFLRSFGASAVSRGLVTAPLRERVWVPSQRPLPALERPPLPPPPPPDSGPGVGTVVVDRMGDDASEERSVSPEWPRAQLDQLPPAAPRPLELSLMAGGLQSEEECRAVLGADHVGLRAVVRPEPVDAFAFPERDLTRQECDAVLDRALAGAGGVRNRVAKDGACQFVAVAAQLRDCSATSLRAAAVASMEQAGVSIDAVDAAGGGVSTAAYLERMREPGEWSDALTLAAVCRVADVTAWILSASSSGTLALFKLGHGVHPVFLTHRQDHYDWFTVPESLRRAVLEGRVRPGVGGLLVREASPSSPPAPHFSPPLPAAFGDAPSSPAASCGPSSPCAARGISTASPAQVAQAPGAEFGLRRRLVVGSGVERCCAAWRREVGAAMSRSRLCLALARARLEPVAERPVRGRMPRRFEPRGLTFAEREGLLRVSRECDVFLFGEGPHGVRPSHIVLGLDACVVGLPDPVAPGFALFAGHCRVQRSIPCLPCPSGGLRGVRETPPLVLVWGSSGPRGEKRLEE